MKRLIATSTLLGITTFPVFAAPARAMSFEVFGVELGMTPAAVEQAARAKGGRPIDGGPAQMVLRTPDGATMPNSSFRGAETFAFGNAQLDALQVDYLPLAKAERAAVIEHRVMYEAGDRPTLDGLMADVRQKYGTPSTVLTMNGRSGPVYVAWSEDDRGTLRTVMDPMAAGTCGHANPLNLGRTDMKGRDLKSYCGSRLLTVTLILSGPDQFVTAMTVSAIDYAGIYAAQDEVDRRMQAFMAARAAEERARAATRKSNL